MRTGSLALALAFAAGHALAQPSIPESPFQLVHPTRRTPAFFDAARACIPSELEGGLELTVRLKDGDLTGARRALAKPAADAEAERDQQALRAILAARTAPALEREAAGRALRRVAERDPRAALRACAWLERARLSLLQKRPHEARVEIARARRAEPEAPAERAHFALWLEAEGEQRAGRPKEAREGWQKLAADADARLALAARIRLIEASFPVAARGSSGDPAAAWRELESLLASAASARLNVEAWSLLAGELAIRAGELDAAHRWLARAELTWRGGLAGIRKADVLAALGRNADARNTLRRIARSAASEDVRELALLRTAGLDLAAGQAARAEASARSLTTSLHPLVRGEALWLVGRAQRAAGRNGEALESYVRLARMGAPQSRSRRFTDDFDTLLHEVTAPSVDCASVLQQLGSRAELLTRRASDAAAVLRVGDCFLELQLPRAALDVYRTAARRFAGDPSAALSLRIATAALASGDAPAARSALEREQSAGAAAEGEIAALRRRWISAALDEREGEAALGIEALAGLAGDASLPPDLRGAVEQALLERLSRPAEAEAAAAALEASIAAEPELGPRARGAIQLRLADLALARGDTGRALSRYRSAEKLLEPGAALDRARHHAALLAGSKQERRDALAAAAKGEPGSAWTRLAALELRLQRLSEQVDPEQAVRP